MGFNYLIPDNKGVRITEGQLYLKDHSQSSQIIILWKPSLSQKYMYISLILYMPKVC